MKKILIFSLNYYPNFVGGAEVAIKEITDRLPAEEFEFHVVTLRFDRDLPKTGKIGNVHIHRIGFSEPKASIQDLGRYPLKLNKYLFQVLAAWKAHRLHQEHHFDGIWAMMAHSCAIPAGIFKRVHPEVKYLLTLQEGDPIHYIEKQMKPVWPLFTQGVHSADRLQAISTFLLSWGLRMGYQGESVVIPNGVDITRFTSALPTDALDAYRVKIGKKQSDRYLVTTSRLVHKNGIDSVIEALPQLPETVSFLIYGIGPDEEKLQALAAERGVGERVRFMGHVGHDTLPLALATSDIFIRTSRSEGMGNSFIEAMAAGVPVVGTPVGGIPDFLFGESDESGKEQTGWLVSTDAPEEIVSAINTIFDSPEKVRSVTVHARALMSESYTWDSVALRMRSLLTDMCRES